MMTFKQVAAPLRKPAVAGGILVGSAMLSFILTFTDPSGVRDRLGLGSDRAAVVASNAVPASYTEALMQTNNSTMKATSGRTPSSGGKSFAKQ